MISCKSFSPSLHIRQCVDICRMKGVIDVVDIKLRDRAGFVMLIKDAPT